MKILDENAIVLSKSSLLHRPCMCNDHFNPPYMAMWRSYIKNLSWAFDMTYIPQYLLNCQPNGNASLRVIFIITQLSSVLIITWRHVECPCCCCCYQVSRRDRAVIVDCPIYRYIFRRQTTQQARRTDNEEKKNQGWVSIWNRYIHVCF